jgi:hypothetical protein
MSQTLFTGFTGGKCYIQGKEVERTEYLVFTQRQFMAKYRDLHGKDPLTEELLKRQNETLKAFADYDKSPVIGPAVEVETMLQMNNGQITVPSEDVKALEGDLKKMAKKAWKEHPNNPKNKGPKAAKPKLEKTDKRKSPEFIAHLRALALKRKNDAAAKRASEKDAKSAVTAAKEFVADQQIAKDVKAAKAKPVIDVNPRPQTKQSIGAALEAGQKLTAKANKSKKGAA